MVKGTPNSLPGSPIQPSTGSFHPSAFVPWSVDLLMAINLAPASDADFFLASAKARSVPRGVAVMSGMRKVSTEPICFPLTHSSCSMVTSGCTCAEGHLNAHKLDEI